MRQIGGVHAPALGQGSKSLGPPVIRHVFPGLVHRPIKGCGESAPLHRANTHDAHAGGLCRVANTLSLAGFAEAVEVPGGVQRIGNDLHHRRPLRGLKGTEHGGGIADACDTPGLDQPFGLKRFKSRYHDIVVATLPGGEAILYRGDGRVGEGVVVGDDVAVKKVEIDVIAPQRFEAPL